MTELEQKLVDLLKLSQQESQDREQRLMEQVNSLQQQVSSSTQRVENLSKQVIDLTEAYERLAALWNEEWQS